ncbi:MAG: hypothetical protein NXI27_00385 [Alphaproteobacteria bacterium]|nr:hypothetical protein [Alphaproteobacteria bacterium]
MMIDSALGGSEASCDIIDAGHRVTAIHEATGGGVQDVLPALRFHVHAFCYRHRSYALRIIGLSSLGQKEHTTGYVVNVKQVKKSVPDVGPKQRVAIDCPDL